MTEIEEIHNSSNKSSIKDLPNQNSTAVTLYSLDELNLIEDETECSNSTLASMLTEENQLEALAMKVPPKNLWQASLQSHTKKKGRVNQQWTALRGQALTKR
ncbi:13842_t:CDS:1, partial [Cetraspora pellucida]